MQNRTDKLEGNKDSIEPFFPVTFNPSRSADFCVHRNTASCVLSISKVFSDAKQLALAGGRKKPPKSAFCMN